MKKTILRLLIFFIGIPLVIALVLWPLYNHLPLHIVFVLASMLAANELYNMFKTQGELISKPYIDITDREWEAIQAGAIADNTLRKILRNTKDDSLKQRAMPKTKRGLSTSQIARAKAMSNNDYSIAQIADMLGVSTSTVSNAIKS